MIEIEKLIRPNILKLQPYSSARDEYKGTKGIFLDANENPYGKLNRYPDPYQKKLKQKLSEIKTIPVENIFIGNGSDEVIDLAFRIFCNPGTDKALTFSPTYGMYKVAAAINDIQLINVPLNDEFQINTNELKDHFSDKTIKLVFICSPNNPTGNNIDNIEFIFENFNGIVFVDEAYIDFSNTVSWLEKFFRYPNLIISQTFSKAWGLAAARVGVAYASSEIIGWYNKVKPPYNVSALNQNAVLKVINKPELFAERKRIILEERETLKLKLSFFPFIIKIFPSDSNFLLIECINADVIYYHLVKEKIIIRNRNTVVKNCIRITVGTPIENQKLIRSLKKYNEKSIVHKR